MTNRVIDPTGPSGADAGSRSDVAERLFLAVIVSAVFASVITANMVNVLLPQMRSDFGASPSRIGWVVTAYSLVYAIGIPLYGRLSDIYGARRIYVTGLSGFVLGSLVAALAPAFPVLFAGRVVQGAGGAAIAALGIVVVAKVIPEERRGAALGLVASSAGIGSAVGPITGGIVGELVGWRGLFVIPMALMLVLIPIARRVLPDDEVDGGRDVDLPGGLMLGMTVGLLLFGITQGQVAGFASATSWGSFLAAIVSASAVAWRNITTSHPFVPPPLLRNGAYLRVAATGFLTTLSYFSVLVLTPLMLAEVNGLTTREAGFVLTPAAIAMAVGARHSGRLSDRVGSRTPILVGLTTLGAGVLFLSTLAGAAPWIVALGVIVAGAGASFVNSPLSSLASRTLARDHLGIGMGLQTGASFLGGGVGVALMSALLTARQEATTVSINPVYRMDAAPYSDTYLALGMAVVLALAMAVSLPSGRSEMAEARGPASPETAGSPRREAELQRT